MKTKAIIRIILFSLGILILGSLLLGGVLIHLFAANGGFSEVTQIIGQFLPTIDGTVSSEGTVNAADVRNIEINWTNGSVIIQRGEGSDITFSESDALNDAEKMVWKLKGDKLVINSSRYKINIGIGKAKDLVITVPMDYDLNDLELNTVSASVTADSLNAVSVTVAGVSGRCSFTGNTVFGELNIETVDGDVTFSGSLEELDCEGVNADFRGSFTNIPRSIEMSTVDGSIDITLPAHAGFTAELDTVSGRFSSDFSTTSSGNRYTCGDGKCSIEISGVSGDITINKA